MDEDDLEDFWRDYLTNPKQVYQNLTCDGWDDDDDDDDDKISRTTVNIRLWSYTKIQICLRNVNEFSY